MSAIRALGAVRERQEAKKKRRGSRLSRRRSKEKEKEHFGYSGWGGGREKERTGGGEKNFVSKRTEGKKGMLSKFSGNGGNADTWEGD